MSSDSLVLNLGSGKDFRQDCINADIQLCTKPDWLLDICNVPWGDAISTRLGDFDIEEGMLTQSLPMMCLSICLTWWVQ